MFTSKFGILASILFGVSIAHPHASHEKRIAVGAIINSCNKVKGQVAVTFDDGPYKYTEGILDQFKAAGQKAS
jgi:peptidoglycan/xylan/chitin deacetylase (PgdA/CDA1 family)